MMVSIYVAIVVPYNATFKPIRSGQPAASNQTQIELSNANEASECRIEIVDILVEVVFVIGLCFASNVLALFAY